MRNYLHAPVTEISMIAEYLKIGQSEGEQLDFKAQPWGKGKDLELCKDVAAFANHLGGDIILGIQAKKDCADNFAPILTIDIPNIIHIIRQGLITHLYPQSFTRLVEITPIARTDEVDHSVIVLSIPPSIDLVAVEDKESDKVQYKFPIRNGRRNDCLRYEEIMTKASTTARSAHIRLKDLASNNAKTHFSNPVLVSVGDTLPSVVIGNGFHGLLKSYNENIITVAMQNSQEYYPYHGQNISLVNRVEPVRVVNDKLLTIPLELIKAVWKDPEGELLHIALDAKIIWYGGVWTIIYD